MGIVLQKSQPAPLSSGNENENELLQHYRMCIRQTKNNGSTNIGSNVLRTEMETRIFVKMDACRA